MTPRQEQGLRDMEAYKEACRNGSQPFSEGLIGQPICRRCRSGYGSTLDGICTPCRGRTAWEVVQDYKELLK